jgi:hypothetical protein
VVDKSRKLRERPALGAYASVSSDGLTGGLALFQDESLQLTILEVNGRFIDVFIMDL